MILYKYKKLKNKELIYKKIKDTKIKVFQPDDFKDYVRDMENHDIEVEVIANTTLKQVSDDNLDENEDYLYINGYNFELKEEKNKNAKFYIPISDTEFIRVEKKSFLFLIILLLLFAALIFGAITIKKQPIERNPEIELEDDGDWDGEMPRTEDSQEYQESTIIPGFAEIKVSGQATLVPLMNPEDNTVNFVYLILEEMSSNIVKTVNSADEAFDFINNNNVNYQNYQDNAGRYMLQDPSTGKTFDIIKEYSYNQTDDAFEIIEKEFKVVYFSKGIAPGKKTDWNVVENLSAGIHNCEFRISTYDVETSAQCYGAVQPVKIIVN